MKYQDRSDAGRNLAAWLRSYIDQPHVIVLALPRGGVPIAFEVAKALRLPLDVFVVRKLGLPFHPEVAMGAIAEGGIRVLNHHIINEAGILHGTVEQIVAREGMELERRSRQYRRRRPLRPLKGYTVIVVDDGLATGATMEVAVRALRELTDGRIIVAAPVGAHDTCQRLRRVADEVVCPFTPDAFSAVGAWYRDFDETTDDEVGHILDLAAERQRSAPETYPAGL
jgi:predicted phosphoribosyltransferase